MEHLPQNFTLQRFLNQLCCAYSSTDMKPVEITLFDDVLYDDGCSALAGKYAAFKLNKTTIFVDKSHVVQVKRWSRAHRGHPLELPLVCKV